MDCLVIGAGTSGAAAAWLLALRGVKVALVDARERRNVGASWMNGVEDTLFDELDLPEPPAGVRVHRAARFIVQAGDAGPRTVVEDVPTCEVDMRALNAWLLELGEAAGVEMRFRARAEVLGVEEGLRQVRIGRRVESVPVVIDSSGLTGSNLYETLDDALDICSAFQGVYHLTDRDAAQRWIDAHDLRPGETLSMAGVEGGFSILNVSVDEAMTEVHILTGAMHRPEYRTGGRIAMEFIRSQGWIGKRIFGGGGLIPLAPGEPSHVEDHLLRIGNAAGHVFTQHGSGVAPGLRAASIAANAVACALQLGNTRADGLWAFDRLWWSGPGAVCAEYQPLRYLSSSLTVDEMALLIEAGIIAPSSVRRALAQAPMDKDVRIAARVARHGIRLRRLLPRLATTILLADQLTAHARRYPDRGPWGGYDAWRDGWQRKLDRARALSVPDAALYAAGLDPRRPAFLT